jgi:hypothetical protein
LGRERQQKQILNQTEILDQIQYLELELLLILRQQAEQLHHLEVALVVWAVPLALLRQLLAALVVAGVQQLL